MYIANPIYDAAFKYLLDDATAAKIFLSQIIGEQIVELTLSPTEIHLPKNETAKAAKRRNSALLTVLRLDFSCRIRAADGTEKTITIELQKAKLPTDVMRFRRYVGSHYQNKGVKFPLYCIYILGGNYDGDLPRRPVLKIDNDVSDADTGEKLSAGESEFIRELTHKSWVIQIRHLPEERLTKLDQLLAIFDQRRQVSGGQMLDIDARKFPAEFEPVLRQLVQAQATKQVRDSMIAEDDYLEYLEGEARRALDAEQETARIKQQIAEEKQRTKLAEQQTAEEKQRVVEAEKQIKAKDALIAELMRKIGDK